MLQEYEVRKGEMESILNILSLKSRKLLQGTFQPGGPVSLPQKSVGVRLGNEFFLYHVHVTFFF